MFGTSNFGTAVTSAPSGGLRHQILTLAPWTSSVPELIFGAEVLVPKFAYPERMIQGKKIKITTFDS